MSWNGLSFGFLMIGTFFAAFEVGCMPPGVVESPSSTRGSEAGPTAREQSGVSLASRQETTMTTEKAMFGAGCFWGVEARFREIEGVVETAVGYAGGTTQNPTYKEVCTDRTGHAEVVQVEFDPSKVSYETLLDVFFTSHDPTTLNRQGPDHGSQYRSAIFTHSPQQAQTAAEAKEKWEKSGKFRNPIVTVIEPASPFYRAEDYHQQYLAKRGMKSCATTIQH